MHWLVLRTLARLQVETGDAVSQRAIAEAAQLSSVAVSRCLGALDREGWVDRGIDGLDARTWRVIVTASGRARLDGAERRLLAVSDAYFADDDVRASLRTLAS